MSRLSEKLEWALMTLRDKLTFGFDESQAVYRREARVRGVLVDAVKEVKRLEEENEKLRDCAEFYADRTNWTFDDVTNESVYHGNGGNRARQVLKELEASKKENLG